MVGAKSMGCTTCKRRKVKCDEQFPICANCERKGRHCTGPKSRFIRYFAPGIEQDLQRDGAAIIKFSTVPTSSSSEFLATDLVSRLIGIKEVGYQLQLLGNFFPYLPSRVGHNRALEAATRCLLSVHQNLICKTGKGLEEDLENYNKAVCLIRKDLCQLGSKTPSETVCAAMILLTCETYKTETGTTPSAWMSHAGGVSALIQAWGPDRIESDFDLAIFASHYGSNVSESIFQSRDGCFLNAPEWEAVRERCLDWNGSPKLDKYILDSLTALAWLPNLLKDIREGNGDFITLQKARHFKALVSKHAVMLENDLDDQAIVSESPAPESVLVPTKYDFCYERVAFRYCLYWTTTIIANSILEQFGDEDLSLALEIESAAENICMSVQYLGRLKPVGVPSLTFVVSMAFGVSSTERRVQLLKEMEALFEHLPVKIGFCNMDYIYSFVTGKLVP